MLRLLSHSLRGLNCFAMIKRQVGADRSPVNTYAELDSFIVFFSGPAAYMLPPVIGPNVVNKSAAPNITLSGRSAIGSFHEDLKKVHQCKWSFTVLRTNNDNKTFSDADSRSRDVSCRGFRRVQTQGTPV